MEIGLIFAFLTAVSFAMSTIFLRRGISQAGESFTAVVVTVFTGTILFSLVMLFIADWDKIWSLSWQGLALFAGAGIIQFIAGRFLNYTSVRLIGANKATALTRSNIFYTVLLGVVLLNESLTIPIVLGVLCIAGGATLVSIEKKSANPKKQSEPSKIPVKGILSGLGAGFFWGVSGVLIKPALAEIDSPAAGAFISFVTASLLIASSLLRKRQRERLARLRRSSLIPLVVAGVFTAVAHLFRYTAFSYSPVSVVAPVISIDSLLVLLFSFLLNRQLEVFTWKVIVGMVATTTGVVLIAY